MESGRPEADSGVGGDPCAPNGKSPKLGSCSLAGEPPCSATDDPVWRLRRSAAVRHAEGQEHPAPSGALRPGHRSSRMRNRLARGQGAPSTIRCIKTGQPQAESDELLLGQGAPSTIRCIKTKSCAATGHRGSPVREHPAPSGALRPGPSVDKVALAKQCQGAPSTIRCIKT